MKIFFNRIWVSKKMLFILFLTQLLISGKINIIAEEVFGKIMFPPQKSITPAGPYFIYNLDTTNDGIFDRRMIISYNQNGRDVVDTLSMYLDKDYEVVFEDRGLPPAPNQTLFNGDRMIAFITPNGQRVELTQLFSLDMIGKHFPTLWQKLVREGKAK